MDNNSSLIRIPRQSCCRLCLAPGTECVAIFGTLAADKQAIASKIQTCVSIQVNASDRLSDRICHACISYLNSWTSFKGRCAAAQRQQKSWLAGQLKKQLLGNGGDAEVAAAVVADEEKPMEFEEDTESYNYYPQYHNKKRATPHDSSKDDEDSGPVTVNMELDPRQLLSLGGADDDDDDENDDGDDDELEEGEFVEPSRHQQKNNNNVNNNAPQILNALGLRIANPMSLLATDMDCSDVTMDDSKTDLSIPTEPLLGTQCRVCRMGFSNRTNARRHEKNVHNLRPPVDLSVSSNSNLATNGIGSSTNSSTPKPVKPPAISSAIAGSPAALEAAAKRPPAKVFNYSNPAKYRHLLTEARLKFIRENAKFLYQYQDMTCKCCNRTYFTYKNFMAHVRKKYATLPRNVCFNCLRRFETKGQFISHLKQRNCMNMFTLFMADTTIPKNATLLREIGLKVPRGGGSAYVPTDEPRLGLKDLLGNKLYGCKLCQNQLRLKNDFKQHIMSSHPEWQSYKDPVSHECRHCHASFTDTADMKRHFSGHDCFFEIICTTCNAKFASNVEFLDHVYGDHLQELKAADEKATQEYLEKLGGKFAGGGGEDDYDGEVGVAEDDDADVADWDDDLDLDGNKQPQQSQQQQQRMMADGTKGAHPQLMPKKNAGCICPVCQKQYNNYYNVLWHFESKHPEFVPKTYRCEICEEMFTKQALLKSHVVEVHADVQSGGGAGGGGQEAHGKYACRHCDDVLAKPADYIAHQLKVHPDEELLTCHECEFVTEQKDKLEEHLRGQHLNLLKMRVLTCTTCKQSFVTEDALKYHQMVMHAEQENSEQLFRRMLKMGKFPKVEVAEPEVKVPKPSAANDDDQEDELLNDMHFMARVNLEESKRVRVCPVCQQKYHVLAEFIVHMQGHVRKDNVTNLDLEPGKSRSGAYYSRMRCRMCEKRISSKVGYKRHLLEVHNVDDCQIVQCALCPGEFSNEKGLRVHLFRTHNICVKEDGEVVTMQPVMPPTTGDSKRHLQQQQQQQQQMVTPKQENVEYECQICHTVYRSLVLLRSHVASVHEKHDFEAYLQKYGSGEVPMLDGGEGGTGEVVDVDEEEDQQQQQLNAMKLMMMQGLLDDPVGTTATDYTPIEVYFQCRYCDDNFASRQKLTAHMNTHDEHDPTDYTCHECGNVYQSRKSLWVHRNKKHPNSQVPSPCEVCKKVFFDKTELVYHLKTHVAQKVELMKELMNATQNGGMEDDYVEDSGGSEGDDDAGEEGEENGLNGTTAKKYDCHVCERKFRDEGKFSQHLRVHEMQNNMFVLGAFTEAGMDDEAGSGGGGGGGRRGSAMGSGGSSLVNGGNGSTGGDPFEPQYNDDGVEEYQCDMCPKKFPQLMALRVHRGWHYRSPDGRQITELGKMWQPGSLRSQRGSKTGVGASGSNRNSVTGSSQESNKQPQVNNNNNVISNNNSLVVPPSGGGGGAAQLGGNPKLPKCQFCSSTFASSNNLRRHIVEVHKRNDWRSTSATGSALKGGVSTGFVDKDRECASCSLTFETRAEWVEHKIGHAKVMRPSTTFEWNCEMCGKVFTRKERLLQHMASHANGEVIQSGSNSSGGGNKGGNVSGGGSGSENSQGDLDDDDDDEEKEEGVVKAEDDDDDDGEPMIVNPDVEMLNDDDEDEDDEDDDDDDDGEVGAVRAIEVVETSQTVPTREVKVEKPQANSPVLSQEKNKSLCCDLCQLSFTAETDLRKHVMSHFFNGAGGGGAAKGVATPPVVRKKGERTGTDEEGEENGPTKKKARIEHIPRSGEEISVSDEEEEGVVANDEDLDEGEYVEEYLDEDSFISPKKGPSPAAAAAAPPAKVAVASTTTGGIVLGSGITVTTTAVCRLCSSEYENNFKALKCMEAHRQRSKFQCPECELYFATVKQLSGHEQLVHGGKVGGS